MAVWMLDALYQANGSSAVVLCEVRLYCGAADEEGGREFDIVAKVVESMVWPSGVGVRVVNGET